MARSPSDAVRSVREGVERAKERAADVRAEASETRAEVRDTLDGLGLSNDDDQSADGPGDPFRLEMQEFTEEGRDVIEALEAMDKDPEPFADPFSESVDAGGEFVRDIDDEDREQLRESDVDAPSRDANGGGSTLETLRKALSGGGQRSREREELQELREEARREALDEDTRQELKRDLQERRKQRYREELGLEEEPNSGRRDQRRERRRDRGRDRRDRRRQEREDDVFGGGGIFGEEEAETRGGVFGPPVEDERRDDRDREQNRGGVFDDNGGIF